MKNRSIKVALRSMEQHPPFENFRPLAEQQQQASSLPVVPANGDAQAPTLAIAKAIKPTATVGQIVADLIANKGTADDMKVVVCFATPTTPARVMMYPKAVTDGNILAGETLLGTIVRDDATKRVSPHGGVWEAGEAAHPAALAADACLQATKPARSVSSLINAVVDALADSDDAEDIDDIAIVFNQDGDGSVKLYRGATLADYAGKTADVTQEAAEVSAATPSEW